MKLQLFLPVPEKQDVCPHVEYLVAVEDDDRLRHLVLQALDYKGVGLVQDSKPKIAVY